jgi:hypothetical protein
MLGVAATAGAADMVGTAGVADIAMSAAAITVAEGTLQFTAAAAALAFVPVEVLAPLRTEVAAATAVVVVTVAGTAAIIARPRAQQTRARPSPGSFLLSVPSDSA